MKKAMLAALVAALLMTFAIGASAAPYVTNGSYASYLGEDNHLFLLDPAGGAKVLRATIVDLVGMNDQELYCLTAENRLYAIALDGSRTSVVSATPTAEDLARVADEPVYTLENGLFSLLQADGTPKPLAMNVLAASGNGMDVYFIRQGTPNKLLRVSLTDPTMMQTEICDAVDAPVSLIATEDSVTMLAGDRSVIIVNLQDNSRRYEPAASAETSAAVHVNGQLFRYTQDENGHYLVENVQNNELRLIDASSVTPTPTATPRPTATPTPTPKPTKTPKPTATPIPDDGNIYYGQSGSDVKKMQRRLTELGYPVNGVDGVFGKNTLIALNLFQGAVKYVERDYATESLLNKLYRYDAPGYDPIAPLEKGATGMAVKLMQQALQDGGFGPEKVDGIYGNDTRKAVRAFQKFHGIEVTGKADEATLATLYKLPGAIGPDSEEGSSTPTDLIIQHR